MAIQVEVKAHRQDAGAAALRAARQRLSREAAIDRRLNAWAETHQTAMQLGAQAVAARHREGRPFTLSAGLRLLHGLPADPTAEE